jgi:hypothetical protein
LCFGGDVYSKIDFPPFNQSIDGYASFSDEKLLISDQIMATCPQRAGQRITALFRQNVDSRRGKWWYSMPPFIKG